MSDRLATTTRLANTTLRTLGPSEHYFWLSNQNAPKHFVLAAHIAGVTDVASWRPALDAVQRRHPLLQVCIAADPSGMPYFRSLPAERIPLRVIHDDAMEAWEQEMARELAAPMPLEHVPLVRAVLMRGQTQSTIIFSAHHSIGDGLSFTYIIRDLLKALSGRTLQALSIVPAQEELCEMLAEGVAEPEAHDQPPPAPFGRPASLLDRNRTEPSIQSLRLSVATTARLRDRARDEGTTVHGALVAALTLAGRGLSAGWREGPVRVMSPVSTRELLGLREDCVLSIFFPVNAYDPQGVAQFWDVARSVTTDLTGMRTRHGTAAVFDAFRQLMSDGPDVPAIARFELQACGCEMMLSNLGVLPIETDYGALTLEALWGPSVFVGIEGEQMIGAATLRGALHLLHSSYTPIPSLLPATERTLMGVLR